MLIFGEKGFTITAKNSNYLLMILLLPVDGPGNVSVFVDSQGCFDDQRTQLEKALDIHTTVVPMIRWLYALLVADMSLNCFIDYS